MLKYQVGGRYRLEIRNPTTGATRASGWFDNLITDQGLNFMGQGITDYLRYCQVGTGSTTPAVTDVGLDTGLASTGVIGEVRRIDSVDRFAAVVMEYKFTGSTAAGNLTEIGVGRVDDPQTSGLFSRALIKDSNGSPLSMTLLADEELTVYYELRVYQPTTDAVMDVNGTTVTVRASGINSLDTEFGWWLGWEAPFGDTSGRNRMAFHAVSNATLRLGDGTLQLATSESLTPTQAAFANTAVLTDAAYQDGSFQRTTTLYLGPAQGNFGNGNPISMLWLAYGPGPFQVHFNPAIPKDDTQALSVGLQFSWARRTL